VAKADKAIIAPREVLGHFIQCSVFHGVGQLGHAGHAPLAHNADGQPLVGDSHTLVSLFLWIALLRGKTKRSTTIGCLAMMLMTVCLLWHEYLR
jgi:hypothetical protein